MGLAIMERCDTIEEANMRIKEYIKNGIDEDRLYIFKEKEGYYTINLD